MDSALVRLENGTGVRRGRRVDINVDPHRDLHGPCAVRAANDDLLLSHQDSDEHRGGDGFTRQWRSRDSGRSWCDEGPAADWRSRDRDALFGEYGLAPDGSLVMVVQRRQVRSGDGGIGASWVQISRDHGRTWEEIGPMDGSDEHAVMFARNLIARDGVFYAGVWSRHGNALYTSVDCGLSWQKRSVPFPVDYPDFGELVNAGPPFYPQPVFCPDGSLLTLTYVTPPRHHCYSRRSCDDGHTWEPIVAGTGLDLWAPRVRQLDERTLIATGRDTTIAATVAWFSTDSGRSWKHRLVVDKPRFAGSYAYTDSLRSADGTFWVFTSSPQSPGRGDIIAVELEVDQS